MVACLLLVLLSTSDLVPAGTRAPNLDWVDSSGRRGLLNYQEQITIVDFFATWCRPCRESMSEYPAILEGLRGQARLVVVDVLEDPEVVRQFFHGTAVPGMSVVMDGDGRTSGAWGVRKFPSVFIVDRTGTIRGSFSGWGPGRSKYLHEVIESLTSAKDRPRTAVAPGPRSKRGRHRAPTRPPRTLDERARQLGVEVIR